MIKQFITLIVLSIALCQLEVTYIGSNTCSDKSSYESVRIYKQCTNRGSLSYSYTCSGNNGFVRSYKQPNCIGSSIVSAITPFTPCGYLVPNTSCESNVNFNGIYIQTYEDANCVQETQFFNIYKPNTCVPFSIPTFYVLYQCNLNNVTQKIYNNSQCTGFQYASVFFPTGACSNTPGAGYTKVFGCNVNYNFSGVPEVLPDISRKNSSYSDFAESLALILIFILLMYI